MLSETHTRPVGERNAWSRARTATLVLLTLQVVTLLVTGVVLFFTYRPSGSAAYGDLVTGDVRSSVRIARAMTTAHQLAARSAVPTAVVAGVLGAIRARPSARRRVDVLVGVGLVLVLVVGSFTGYLLPFDQLGLRAVSVGNDMRGYVPLFDDDRVRFALVGGAQVAPGTVVRWLLFHMLVIGSVLGALLAVAWRRSGQRQGAG